MNKKELIKFIDRIPDTGPKGTENIKKVLKKLVEDSDSQSGSSSSDSSSSGCGCLQPMVVRGEFNFADARFEPDDDQPSFAQAAEQIRNHGLLYVVTGETNDTYLVLGIFNDDGPDIIHINVGNDSFVWLGPITVHGTIASNGEGGYDFTQNNGEMTSNQAQSEINNGYQILLSWEDGNGNTITGEAKHSEDMYGLYVEEYNVVWLLGIV